MEPIDIYRICNNLEAFCKEKEIPSCSDGNIFVLQMFDKNFRYFIDLFYKPLTEEQDCLLEVFWLKDKRRFFRTKRYQKIEAKGKELINLDIVDFYDTLGSKDYLCYLIQREVDFVGGRLPELEIFVTKG